MSARAAMALGLVLAVVVLAVIFWDQVVYGVSIIIGMLLLGWWWNAATRGRGLNN
jgi:hypothetical protein